MNKEEYYQNLFEEYQNLRAVSSMADYNYDSSKEIEAQHIKVEDTDRISQIIMELKNNLVYLTDEQLRELYMDDDTQLVNEAVKVLANRKLERD